jgi:hypothetical protein
LDLNDFPGQGTALVGVLDPFWESKGYITPEEYRRFCNSTVPLAKMEKRVWGVGETFNADVEIAHFGPAPLTAQTVSWQLLDDAGETKLQGTFGPQDILVGNVQPIGQISFSVKDFKAAQKYSLVIRLDETVFENDWDIWFFDPGVKPIHIDTIIITNELNNAVTEALNTGSNVLYLPPAERVRTTSVIGFSSLFWNTAWTNNQEPHTLGILCDPEHPVFASFPTEYHSNWQWWELIHGAAAMQLDNLPPELRPLVQPIDTWFENRRLGLLLEAQVGSGKLMIASMDLETDLDQRLVARQLRHSVLAYMQSEAFQPKLSLSLEQIQDLLTETN